MNSNSMVAGREIDLAACVAILLNHKWKIVIFSSLVAMLAAIGTLFIENTYRSVTVLKQVKSDGELSGLQSMASQFGGLASLAGINLQESEDDSTLSLSILKTRQFVLEFINENDLAIPLIAGKAWSWEKRSFIIDEDLYKNGEWRIESNDGSFREPNQTELFDAFNDIFSVNQDVETGLIKLSIESYSPSLAAVWLSLIVDKINLVMKENALKESEAKIAYLEEKIRNTDLSSIKSVFSQLIENELQRKMLLDTKEQYVLKTIDPPYIPDEKFKPLRAVIVILIFVGAVILSSVVVLYRYSPKNTSA
ncbi:Wzz/FepE/Etk N-terminal domain-containing protein [Aliiglaciecola sp. CAU 1673]|uniref:Wzz/FepE/Etk N-terminal domain-containing protein n=1 Tax=Aliiglaciecola sp. CAU 1673 TaxID=3032595 RepID=UPI0023DB9A18|nr:Wzz/FepE/Etk N-terminal domain-containing protein [Aliiglaciecola sp. CAU 1673]MDF2177501.1 Wzz/FepE/Etk N-terminal domain-containing protein [Aliiglaciecola sp. CAU 1673]